MPGSGERMRNLTTTGLGEKSVKQRWASQSPLRIHSVLLGDVKELDGDKVTFHEVLGYKSV